MNLLLRISVGFLRFLYWLVIPILRLINHRQRKRNHIPKSVTESNDTLLQFSATQLAQRIRTKQLSSVTICQAYIKRIKEVNPVVNAFVEERFEEALEEARNVDKVINDQNVNLENLKISKPLLGVPLTIKESCALKGMSFSVGVVDRSDIKADCDGETVEKLRTSGAIPLLVSNTPELCLGWECTNRLTGTTRNPFNTTCTSGGSSGGEGALLGAGASIIGIGSDVGGSIRLPALFNGIFAHKPTPRLVSNIGHFPHNPEFDDYLVIGPLVRYAEDLKLMLRCMLKNEKSAVDLGLNQKVEIDKLNVYYMENEGYSLVFPKVQCEIRDSIIKAVDYLRFTCHCRIVDDVKFTELEDSCEIAGSVLYSLQNIPNLLKSEKKSLVGSIAKALFVRRTYKKTLNLLLFYTIQAIYKYFIYSERYMEMNAQLKQKFIETLGDNGVLLYPTFSRSAIQHNSWMFWLSALSYLVIVNTLGLPSTHVPCGLDANGLPIGFQVIAAPNQDRLCLAVAEELEICFGGWIPPK